MAGPEAVGEFDSSSLGVVLVFAFAVNIFQPLVDDLVVDGLVAVRGVRIVEVVERERDGIMGEEEADATEVEED